MKRIKIARCIFLSLLSFTLTSAFAQSEVKNTDREDTASAEVLSDVEAAPVETPVHNDWDDEDYDLYAHDGSGRYARDKSGNRVRVGSLPVNVPKVNYIERERNLIEIEKDDIRLILDGNAGTFAIYGVGEKGNYIPLLSTYDAYSSSYFSVKVGSKEYKLQSNIDIKTEARNTPLGAQMAYYISEEVQVVLDFSIMPSIATSSRMDMIRVTVFVINIGRNIQSFAVKGVFDTVLGENTTSHFSTSLHSSINSEIQFQSMDEELWVRSSNPEAAIQFLLGGKEISKIETVTLASRDKIDTSTWIPSVMTARSFNSVTSYNNSAIAVNWPASYLDTFRTSNYGFYISVATGMNAPAGQQFLKDLENGKTALGTAATSNPSKTSVAPDPIPLSKEEYDSITPSILDNLPTSSKEAFVKTREMMDADYIQDLIDHIQILQDDENEVDKAELDSLNEELDTILKRLGAGR